MAKKTKKSGVTKTKKPTKPTTKGTPAKKSANSSVKRDKIVSKTDEKLLVNAASPVTKVKEVIEIINIAETDPLIVIEPKAKEPIEVVTIVVPTPPAPAPKPPENWRVKRRRKRNLGF